MAIWGRGKRSSACDWNRSHIWCRFGFMALRPQRSKLSFAFFFALAGCLASTQACDNATTPSGNSDEVDANGDKVADDLGQLVDADKDGQADTVDLNQDGKAEGFALDTDGDGEADALALDVDCDGLYDAIDTTRDGKADFFSGVAP